MGEIIPERTNFPIKSIKHLHIYLSYQNNNNIKDKQQAKDSFIELEEKGCSFIEAIRQRNAQQGEDCYGGRK